MSRHHQTTILSFISAFLFAFMASAYGNTPQKTGPIFCEIATKTGLDFVHFNGMSGKFYFPEMTGQGGAVFDMDGDGDLDIYLVQGAILNEKESMKDMVFPSKEAKPKDRLYRNDLIKQADGSFQPKFVDITEKVGLNNTSYGMGVLAADFNNDGRIDLYVTNYGPNQLFFQMADGSFQDVTASAGVGDPLWGTSAAAIDFNRDGLLDIYLANYVDYDLKANPACYATSSRRDYCGPASFPPQKDRLYLNKGQGRFEDVTDRLLEGYEAHSGLGVVTTDVNQDGWLDLIVANDGQPNHLWVNNKGNGFMDDALFSGLALNMDGNAEASMGICAGDIDGDGDEDIFMAHLMGESNTLYLNDGSGLFEDKTLALGIGAESFPFTSFGANLIDFDNDGWLDLFVASGAVRIIERLAAEGDPYPIHQPNQLYHNQGGKTFSNVTAKVGSDFLYSEVSRGTAMGDLDNDGDSDIIVFNNNGHVRVYENLVGHGQNWIGFRCLDPKTKRDDLGANITVIREGKSPLVHRVRVDGSYCSSNDARVLFGLGSTAQIPKVTIQWSDGSTQELKAPSINTYHVIKKGTTP